MLDIFLILWCSKTPLKVRVTHHRAEWNLPLPCLAGDSVPDAPQHTTGPHGYQGTGDSCSIYYGPGLPHVFLLGWSLSSHPPVQRYNQDYSDPGGEYGLSLVKLHMVGDCLGV